MGKLDRRVILINQERNNVDLISTPAEVALQAMLTCLRATPGTRTGAGWIIDGVEYYIEEEVKHKDGSIDGFVTRLDTGKAIGSFEIAADGRVKWFPCSGPQEWAAATETAKANLAPAEKKLIPSMGGLYCTGCGSRWSHGICDCPEDRVQCTCPDCTKEAKQCRS